MLDNFEHLPCFESPFVESLEWRMLDTKMWIRIGTHKISSFLSIKNNLHAVKPEISDFNIHSWDFVFILLQLGSFPNEIIRSMYRANACPLFPTQNTLVLGRSML
jgi:hypothetical protein